MGRRRQFCSVTQVHCRCVEQESGEREREKAEGERGRGDLLQAGEGVT